MPKPANGFVNWRRVQPLAWCRATRNILISSKATLVGHVLAMHANAGSGQTRLSVLRLAYETKTSKSTVIRALAELEEIGLLWCVERGSANGRQRHASVYQLTLHDRLPETSFADWLAEHHPDAAKPDEPWEQVPA